MEVDEALNYKLDFQEVVQCIPFIRSKNNHIFISELISFSCVTMCLKSTTEIIITVQSFYNTLHHNNVI